MTINHAIILAAITLFVAPALLAGLGLVVELVASMCGWTKERE